MAEETLAQVDAQKTQSAEEGIADFLFGEEQQEEDFDYEPSENAHPEGEEAEETEEETEEEPEVEASEEESDGLVEIEIDGEILEVPEKYKDYFLRQQDYTQKTQEIASQRKEIEVVQGQYQDQLKAFEFAESIKGDVLKAEQLDAQANEWHKYLRDNLNDLTSQQIEQIRFAIQDAREQRDEIAKEVQGKQQEFQQAREQSLGELLNKGTEVLKAKIPNWGEEHQKQVRDYALNLGFTEAEISNVIDPRQVEVLYKASQYDSLQRNKSAAVKKVQKAPAIKPKARDNQGRFTKQQKINKALKSNKLSAPEKASLIGESMADFMYGKS